MSRSPFETFLIGLLVGTLVGGAIAGVAASDAGSSSPDPDAPPTSVSSTGASCYDGPRDDNGWMHVMANGQSWAVTVNATVVHPPGTHVEANVSRRSTGAYEIAFRTVRETRTEGVDDSDCRLATRLDVATALANPEVAVTANGREVRSVAQDETVANLYPLPNPVNATAG